MSKYQLETDESIILRKECVYVFGSLECTADSVLLTTHNLIIEYTTGFWNNKVHIDKFPLTDIKQYKSIPQVKLGEHDDEPVLEIYFANAQLLLDFSEVGNKKKQTQCINEWIEKTIDALSDLVISQPTKKRTLGDSTILCHSCGKALPLNSSFCTNCGAKVQQDKTNVVCKNCGKPIPVGMNFCTECGTAVEIRIASNEDDVVNESSLLLEPKEEHVKGKMSIDQQIELLQKLKSLVDAGVLSQEEFEMKKKEILK